MEAIDRNNSIFNANSGLTELDAYKGKKTRPDSPKTQASNDSFNKKSEKQENRNFSFLEFGKNTVRGSGQFFIDIYKTVVKNPFIAIPIIAASAAVASTPIGLALLAGSGVFATAFSAISLGINAVPAIYNKKWDEVEKQGTELGKLIPGMALSVLGAVKAVRQIETISGATNLSGVGKCIQKAGDLSMFSVTAMKNIVMAPVKAFNRFVRGQDTKVFMGAMKDDWIKFVNENAKATDGNWFTKNVMNFLFRPNLNTKLFSEGTQLNFLQEAANKPWTQAGFLDFTLGIGRKGKTVTDAAIAASEALHQA